MVRFLSTALFVLCIPACLFSQGFIDVSEQQGLLINTDGLYGSGVSFYDYNGDGWADLSFPTNGNGIQRYRNDQGSFVSDTPIYIDDSEYEMAAYADFDNDGDKDLYVCKSQMGSYLFENVNGSLVDITTDAGLCIENVTTQGACWGDYDLDGYLDLYVANYDSENFHNWLFHNNGDGTFTEVSEVAGVDDGLRASFQGVWMDYNRDLLPDLFVVNDRSLFTNAMYRNNGDGTFSDVSSELGLDLGFDAMCGTVADVDYDGDLDIYCTNDPNGNKLFLNQDGGFEEVADMWGLSLHEESWGSVWVDLNNDMTQDLIVCKTTQFQSNNQPFYLGTSETEYTPFDEAFIGGTDFLSTGVATADFTHNGYIDVVVQTLAPEASKLWRNIGEGKGSVSVELEGVLSNKEAVGVWIDYWADDKQRTLYTMNGGSYMSQNETRLTLPTNDDGIGIDSIRIEWPSGIIDTHYDLRDFESYSFSEGSSFQAFVQADQDFFCPGDSLELRAEPGLIVEWSNGLTAPSIFVNETGPYFYNYDTPFGTSGVSDFIFVQTRPIPSIEYEIMNPITCHEGSDGIVELEIDPTPSVVLWSHGAEGTYLDSLSTGNYIANIEDESGCLSEFEFQLSQPDSLQLELISSPVSCYGDSDGEISWSYSGGTGDLEVMINAEDPASLEAGSYSVMLQDLNGCTIEETVLIEQPDALMVVPFTEPAENNDGSIVLVISGGVPEYDVFWSNGETGPVLTDLDSGSYFYYVLDDNGCEANGQVTVESVVNVGNNIVLDRPWIYPNPADDYIQIEALDFDRFAIKCISGKIVRDGRIFHEKPRIITSDLPNGSYILYLYHASTTAQVRVHIMHQTYSLSTSSNIPPTTQ